jgi:hypothetical protein
MASGSVEAIPPTKRRSEIFQAIIRFDFAALSYLICIFLMPPEMPLLSPVQISVIPIYEDVQQKRCTHIREARLSATSNSLA